MHDGWLVHLCMNPTVAEASNFSSRARTSARSALRTFPKIGRSGLDRGPGRTFHARKVQCLAPTGNDAASHVNCRDLRTQLTP